MEGRADDSVAATGEGGADHDGPDRRRALERRSGVVLDHVRRFAETLPVPFTATTDDGYSLVVNQAYCDLVGVARDAVGRRSMEDAVHPGDVAASTAAVLKADPDEPDEIEVRLRHAQGHYLRAVWRLRRDPASGLVFAVVLDVSDERQVAERLHHESRHDSLTGAANRLLVMTTLTGWLREAAAAGHEVGVALVDMDRFKTVNDQHGHRVGDLLLVETARRLQAAAPDGSLVGRMGGDEFIVVVPRLDAADMPDLAARLMAVQGDTGLRGQTVQLRASIGISTGSGAAEQLLHQADVAAYVAKQAGGGGWAPYDEAVRRDDEAAQLRDRLVIAAAEADRIGVVFRPIRHLATDRLEGLEATAVLDSPGGESLQGPQVVEAALRLGLDQVLPDVRRRAVQQIVASGVQVPLHLDLTARDLADPDRLQRLVDAVEDHGLPADRLVLEVREDILLLDVDGAVAQLLAARRRGCRVAIDGFGIGSSSLRQLAVLPLDLLKIDGAFVTEAQRTTNARTIIAGLLSMAPSLGVTVVMDGIDTAADLALARRLGVTLVQGGQVGAALSAADLTA